MPHLDEGQLHAYLDDALPKDVELHLRECAKCRANLKKARALKEDAATILVGAAPVEVVMPAFEELQARAEARNGTSDGKDERQANGEWRGLYQLRTLAWAATVVIAVAVGWYARSSVLQTGQDRFVSENETSGRLTIPLPEAAGIDSETSNEGAQTSMPRGEQEEASPSFGLEELEGEQVTPDEVGGIAVPADQRESLQARRVNTLESGEPPTRSRQSTEIVAAPLPVVRVDTTVATAAGAGFQQPEETREMPQLLPQVAADRAAAAPTLAQTAAGRGGGAEISWTSADEATATDILDGPVPTVEGLPTVTFATSTINGRPAIRVQQRLESGQLLELVITPEDDTNPSTDAKKGKEFVDAAPGETADSPNSVAIWRGNLHIRISAALATDSLRVLGRSIPSGR